MSFLDLKELGVLGFSANGHRPDPSIPTEGFHLTEWGNVKGLVTQHGDRIRYCWP